LSEYNNRRIIIIFVLDINLQVRRRKKFFIPNLRDLFGTIRLATFNCKNLFARFRFDKNIDAEKAVKGGWLANKTYFHINDEMEKELIAAAIKAIKADVIPLQEIENNKQASPPGRGSKDIHLKESQFMNR
jgi:predicted extracellular nuclease